MTEKELEQEARKDALKRLRNWLKPGDTVSTVLVPTSRGEAFKAIINSADGPFNASVMAARVTGHEIVDEDRIRMPSRDTAFWLVMGLGRELFPDGFKCTGKNCPSNDHHNGEYRKHHPDGSYALHHRWI